MHYFGVWADWQAALNRYLAQRDYLHTGQVPPTEAATLGNLLDLFLEGKDQKLQASETDLERKAQTCDDLFQRSSSCVEGRNGQLSLKHHALRCTGSPCESCRH